MYLSVSTIELFVHVLLVLTELLVHVSVSTAELLGHVSVSTEPLIHVLLVLTELLSDGVRIIIVTSALSGHVDVDGSAVTAGNTSISDEYGAFSPAKAADLA